MDLLKIYWIGFIFIGFIVNLLDYIIYWIYCKFIGFYFIYWVYCKFIVNLLYYIFFIEFFVNLLDFILFIRFIVNLLDFIFFYWIYIRKFPGYVYIYYCYLFVKLNKKKIYNLFYGIIFYSNFVIYFFMYEFDLIPGVLY